MRHLQILHDNSRSNIPELVTEAAATSLALLKSNDYGKKVHFAYMK